MQISSQHHAHVLLALLWAGLTNVSATAFWAIAFLLLPSNSHWASKVQHRLGSAGAAFEHMQQLLRGERGAGGCSSIDTAAVRIVCAAVADGDASLITACVHEALRLRAPGARFCDMRLRRCAHQCNCMLWMGSHAGECGCMCRAQSNASRMRPCMSHCRPPARLALAKGMALFQWHQSTMSDAGIVLRKAMAPLRLQAEGAREEGKGLPAGHGGAASTVVPRGSVVALSPYLLHHDDSFFPHAHVFDPTRHCAARASGAAERQCIAQDGCPHADAWCSQAGGTGSPAPCAAHMAASAGSQGSARPALSPAEMPALPPLRVTFGVGQFRCPGRALALAEASMAVAVFFACTNATLPAHGGHQDNGHSASESRASGCPGWLQADRVPGAHVVARSVRSGDPLGQLPAFDPRQLVGVKKPMTPLWVDCVHAAAGVYVSR
jgi:Cytochrome P450